MEQKTKFIIIGLIGLSVIFFILFISAVGSKQQIAQERDALQKEKNSLESNISELKSKVRDYESKISSFNREFSKVSQERDESLRRLELANKEKEMLAEKLKTQQQTQQMAQSQATFVSPSNDAYWAGILKAKADLEMQLGSVRSELKTIQISNEQLQRDKANAELDLNNLRREKEDLSRQLDYNQKLMDSIAQELVRERNDKTQIQESYKAVKNENALLTRQLKGLTVRKINLDEKLQQIQEEKSTIERRVTEMETMLTEKISQIESLKEQLDAIRVGAKGEAVPQLPKKESVELPPIVVRPAPKEEPAIEEPAVALEGKILAINKDNNFVIIDFGSDAGAKVGDAFQVYRDGKAIANIEVIQARRNISACDIKRESASIKIGDIVK